MLQGLNIAIRPGEKIAILGRIGSGKSTLLRLAAGLYTPTEGVVLLDGVDMRQIDPADVRAHVSLLSRKLRGCSWEPCARSPTWAAWTGSPTTTN